MINATILPNGNLRVTAGNETRTYIKENERRGYWGCLADIFEQHSCNGSFTPFDAGRGDPFVGLTSAPCVAESMNYEDDGSNTIEGRCWWFPDYCIRDPLDELKTRGVTIFKLAEGS